MNPLPSLATPNVKCPLFISRYSRQLLLPSIGVQGQIKLATSTALIVGAGGLGCPVALYLAGAGVGTTVTSNAYIIIHTA